MSHSTDAGPSLPATEAGPSQAATSHQQTAAPTLSASSAAYAQSHDRKGTATTTTATSPNQQQPPSSLPPPPKVFPRSVSTAAAAAAIIAAGSPNAGNSAAAAAAAATATHTLLPEPPRTIAQIPTTTVTAATVGRSTDALPRTVPMVVPEPQQATTAAAASAPRKKQGPVIQAAQQKVLGGSAALPAVGQPMGVVQTTDAQYYTDYKQTTQKRSQTIIINTFQNQAQAKGYTGPTPPMHFYSSGAVFVAGSQAIKQQLPPPQIPAHKGGSTGKKVKKKRGHNETNSGSEDSTGECDRTGFVGVRYPPNTTVVGTGPTVGVVGSRVGIGAGVGPIGFPATQGMTQQVPPGPQNWMARYSNPASYNITKTDELFKKDQLIFTIKDRYKLDFLDDDDDNDDDDDDNNSYNGCSQNTAGKDSTTAPGLQPPPNQRQKRGRETHEKWEECRAGGTTFYIPVGLMGRAMGRDGSGIRLIAKALEEAWKSQIRLPPGVKEDLKKYLPKGQEETALEELFSGKNINFGNPLRDFFFLLGRGVLVSKVQRQKAEYYTLYYANHIEGLREYYTRYLAEAERYRNKVLLKSVTPVYSKPQVIIHYTSPVQAPPPASTQNNKVWWKAPFLFFVFLKNVFTTLGPRPVPFDTILEHLKGNPSVTKDIPTNIISPEVYLRLGLCYLANFPTAIYQHFSAKLLGSVQQPSQVDMPIVKSVPPNSWCWSDQKQLTEGASQLDKKLQDIEQLFSFAVTRGYFDSEKGEIMFELIWQNKGTLTLKPTPAPALEMFHKQEEQRYLNPDLPYIYEVPSGSVVVAPCRANNGGAQLKPRAHHLLLKSRPWCVNILSLVRDSMARLPGGVGTRADVTKLFCESQYVTAENADMSQVSVVVNGALDRLQAEASPSVKFDSDNKLWTYLHRHYTIDDFK